MVLIQAVTPVLNQTAIVTGVVAKPQLQAEELAFGCCLKA